MPSSSFNLWCEGYDIVRLNQANAMDVPVLVFIFFFVNKHTIGGTVWERGVVMI